MHFVFSTWCGILYCSYLRFQIVLFPPSISDVLNVICLNLLYSEIYFRYRCSENWTQFGLHCKFFFVPVLAAVKALRLLL